MDLASRMAELIQQIILEELTSTLSYLGELCVQKARDRSQDDSWYDQTGNLRSSIGFAVIDHGRQVISSAFNAVSGPKGNGSQGASSGRDAIDSLASKYTDTLALVVVAGMDYASYVEAKDNKDVLASTELWAQSVVDKYMQKGLEKAMKRIDSLTK